MTMKSIRDFLGPIFLQLYITVGRKVEVGLPPKGCANIELTNECTLDCKACPRFEMSRPIGRMEEQVFKEIVDQIAIFSDIEFLWLHHFGDPLIHPKLEEFSDYATEKGLETGISTKGNLLTKERIESLANSSLSQVCFSFGGMGRRYEEFQRGARFEPTMEKIESFIQKPDLDPKVTVQLLTTPETPKEEIETFKERFQQYPQAETDVKECHDWTGDCERVKEAVGENPRNQFDYPCVFPWTTLSILWNGDVVPCCHDYDGKYVLGNIEKWSLEEIWNNERMRELRRAHLDGDRGRIDLCRSCTNSVEPLRSRLKSVLWKRSSLIWGEIRSKVM